MPQFFKRSTNAIARFTIFGSVVFLVFLVWVLVTLDRSAYSTGRTVVRHQPVPFSHDHHVAAIGIDCRYCHTSVEESSSAGMPPTATCMNCHKQIWADSPMLEPVRESYRTGVPIQWNRVYDLPDFVYFDHSIHVRKGIGCASCHGRIDRMPLTWQAESLQMEWCIACHRNPEQHIRPREHVFDLAWEPGAESEPSNIQLVTDYDVAPATEITSCSVCHR